MTCAGCSKPVGDGGAVVVAMGRTARLCPACTRRAQDSTVFAQAVARCVAVGTTVHETEGVFAKAGLTMPTTEAGVRGIMAELVRRFEAETGIKAPPGFGPDKALEWLRKAAL